MISSLARLGPRLFAARLKTLSLAAVAALAGCSVNPIYTTTGVVLSNYSEGEATPYVLQMSDAQMACALGEGVDPLLYSFSRVTDAPDSTGSLLMLLAGNCAEYEAWEAELAYLRADYEGDVAAAKDAREVAKRLNALTAKRRYASFKRAMAAYEFDPAAEPLECPFLFTEQDEITFLLGLLTGMQAIVNDANSGAMAGVPRNIAPQAERAATCLDNESGAECPMPSGRWSGCCCRIPGRHWRRIPGRCWSTAGSWASKKACGFRTRSRLLPPKPLAGPKNLKKPSPLSPRPMQRLRSGTTTVSWMKLLPEWFAFLRTSTGPPTTAIGRRNPTSAG